ncbi:hypothetical protein [Streptomyces uncialis]|uniref:Uncharacterized protein n=1 Tax=Streptomyces uncialis TaxID=1048205 RepID=A0A1Q4VBV1_9ACTN|nr:hypothetical protein [Streptomyces uncialis]OKH95324.1 hypothetical protein AB852_00010 [Streptomyces uncialis]
MPRRPSATPWPALLVPAKAVNLYLAYAVVTTTPGGAWDENTLTGIETACSLLLLTAALTESLNYAALRHRALPHRWLILATCLPTVACVRWGRIVQRYPG